LNISFCALLVGLFFFIHPNPPAGGSEENQLNHLEQGLKIDFPM
jgi:hypothetical protein